MTLRDTAKALLRFLEKDQRAIPVNDSDIDDPLPDVLTAINGAIQEMSVLSPTFIYRARRSVTLHAPTSITIPATTANEATFDLTVGQGWQSWFEGCSFRVGSGKWNEILHRSGDTVTCLHALEATGSNVEAVVYHDSVTPEDDVLRVLSPVQIADRHVLSPVESLTGLQEWLYRGMVDQDFEFHPAATVSLERTTTERLPRVYFVDSHFAEGVTTPSRNRIRLAPMPRETAILDYRARLKPSPFVMSDIYASESPDDDPGTEIPVPSDYVESVFLPICCQRFQASPMFRNESVKPEIARQYDTAKTILARLKAQVMSGRRLRPGP